MLYLHGCRQVAISLSAVLFHHKLTRCDEARLSQSQFYTQDCSLMAEQENVFIHVMIRLLAKNSSLCCSLYFTSLWATVQRQSIKRTIKKPCSVHASPRSPCTAHCTTSVTLKHTQQYGQYKKQHNKKGIHKNFSFLLNEMHETSSSNNSAYMRDVFVWVVTGLCTVEFKWFM